MTHRESEEREARCAYRGICHHNLESIPNPHRIDLNTASKDKNETELNGAATPAKPVAAWRRNH
ncbi:hypothetical protein [Paramagnetospirillum magnetotacticum]|uniref:hypothetical protein n=1 Tax=Paramagnetospirillum magnetotacticum TaxID=188 RepID=UPI00126A627E|nr:hypothetical protein [Paramagnetospirillum magnetotacticum]